MGGKQYTNEETVLALRQSEYGTPIAEIILKLGVSEQTFYRWKKNSQSLGSPNCDDYGQ